MKRFSLASSLLAATLGLSLALPANANDPRSPDPAYVAAPIPAKGEISFDYKLSGYVFGLKLISARYKGLVGKDSYSVYSDMKTSGLAALLKKQRLWSYSGGNYNKADLKPVTHIQQNLNKKSRRIEVDYDYKKNKLSQTVVPRHGSMGTPPATPAQAFGSDDVNTAMLKVLLTGYAMDGEVCKDTIPVYDGKQHYNLRMTKVSEGTLKFDGKKYPSVRCNAYFDPISGFDPEDLPSAKEQSKPVKVYLIERKDYGMYMPVKFTYKVGGFKATVKVKKATLKKG